MRQRTMSENHGCLSCKKHPLLGMGIGYTQDGHVHVCLSKTLILALMEDLGPDGCGVLSADKPESIDELESIAMDILEAIKHVRKIEGGKVNG